MSDPTNKTELLARMRDSYAAFEALLAPLSAELLCAPGVNGEWSIKDILAHLTIWQERVSTQLEAIARGEESPLDPIANDEQMHVFNNATVAASRARPLSEVQADFRATVQRLSANVEAAGEAALFEPGRFAWLDGGTMATSIAGNTFEHYAEHVPMIEALLADQQR